MCRTMKELERVVADYRSMKAMKEQIDAEVKSLEYEIIGYMDANEKLTETGNDNPLDIKGVRLWMCCKYCSAYGQETGVQLDSMKV